MRMTETRLEIFKDRCHGFVSHREGHLQGSRQNILVD